MNQITYYDAINVGIPMSTELNAYSEVFSRNMKILLHVFDIKQKDLGEELGLKPAAISDIINGRNHIHVKYLTQIAQKYSVSLDWLLLDEGQMKRDEIDPKIVQIFKQQRLEKEASSLNADRAAQLIQDVLVRQERSEQAIKKLIRRLDNLG